jgi:hypothetical protein
MQSLCFVKVDTIEFVAQHVRIVFLMYHTSLFFLSAQEKWHAEAILQFVYK